MASPNAAPKHDSDELSSMTVSQLKELAADEGIKLTATRKADIIDQIMAE